MRVSYTSNPPEFNSEEDKAVVQRVLDRRHPDGLWKLDRALLHSPLITDGFNAFVGSIRNKTSLPPALREIAFLRVAVLCNCWYEWDIHAAIARSVSIPEEGLLALLKGDLESQWLTEQQKAVITYADAVSSSGCSVSDGQVEKLKGFLDEKQVVEMTACIAGFNLVARFITALDVGEKNGPNGH